VYMGYFYSELSYSKPINVAVQYSDGENLRTVSLLKEDQFKIGGLDEVFHGE